MYDLISVSKNNVTTIITEIVILVVNLFAVKTMKKIIKMLMIHKMKKVKLPRSGKPKYLIMLKIRANNHIVQNKGIDLIFSVADCNSICNLN
ncbi:MAG: hypothetical protein COX02_00185 [Candidatus Vogelbacteria bacterium CG22_combo_CG10-13_8_21_14_all_37_9]|uniref:Uncharacterized protein n=1 Tax=Candidatus Vogelbacteria bacterium CG22_combo_CG10-13_8_21_14_all_37_9 TaxID=1975046 RepID=A0A2H0BLP1_9BACT|nr:MAG: hypothetical protein COX02_00185 [Candidatus Vogelbacteria bacterium CG22_combo_CG10-13_8_21_14_all_37_9]